MRLYAIDANGLGHFLWHSRTRVDDAGNELSLADATRQWFMRFSLSMKPTHAVVCFDGPDNWRVKAYTEYKSSRLARPREEDKIAALKTLPQAWTDLGLNIQVHATYEADDVMATVANAFAGPECEVVIVSSDKDMMQLVGPRVTQYDPRPNRAGVCVYYDEAAVEEKLKVPPHRVVELLALMGDASDDVPGVKGWGQTRAVNAIRQTQSWRELWRKAERGELSRIDAKHQVELTSPQGRADFELSRKLVSLKYDVPIPLDISAFAIATQQVAA